MVAIREMSPLGYAESETKVRAELVRPGCVEEGHEGEGNRQGRPRDGERPR